MDQLNGVLEVVIRNSGQILRSFVKGQELEEAVARGRDGIPDFVREAVLFLDERKNCCEQGLYRQAPPEKQRRTFWRLIEDAQSVRNAARESARGSSPHVVSAAVMDYFEAVPDGIIPHELYRKFVETEMDDDQLLVAVDLLWAELPEDRRKIMVFLLEHLGRVAYQMDNHMDAKNLGLCFGPRIFTVDGFPNMLRPALIMQHLIKQHMPTEEPET